ncbi:head maturation protease, ClpP-related [Lactobacillus helveticus]|uniref:head maturation protease, ClpP-related n=1 Tax=Lactobacillus helveticus TaxID=1587 RepID=UPI0013FDEDBE|nr:head maturation protease, ClpP-related [Lactobacillus helveticus]NHL94349.1 Clp protease ClpP [Lactobacillus helveticus]
MKTIQMKGEVIPDDYSDVYDWLNYQYFSPQSISDALKNANGEDVTLEINSPGGYIDAGSEIYTELMEYPGTVNAKIVGYACSAASWIALAADHVVMSPTAQMMIHRASGGAIGNSSDMKSEYNALNQMDKSFVDLYAKRTGKSPEEIYQMMVDTTWMNAKTAVENGFADEVMFENKEPALVNADGSLSVKPEMINKIKNLLHRDIKKTNDVSKPIENKEKQPKKSKKNDLALLLWS